MFLLTAVLAGIVGLLIGWIVKDIVKYRNETIKGSPALPIVGNGIELMGDSHHFFNILVKFFKTYGDRYRFYVAQKLFVILSNPKDVEVMLSSQEYLEKSDEYDYLLPWLGTGLLTSFGSKWRRQRKILTPAFHFKILEHFLQVFDTQSDILVQKLKLKSGGHDVDIFPEVTMCTLDVICEAAMGVSVNAQNDSESVYVNAVQTMSRIANERQRVFLKRWNETFIFTRDYWEQKKALKILHGVTDDMIKTRREKLKEANVDYETYTADSELGAKKKLAFLDLLLLTKVDGKPLPDSSIREEVDTFLFEGHDTTASGVAFSMYAFSQNPDVQEKLYKEQMEIMHDKGSSPSYTDLQQMKLLDMAIKEAMRLYPPVPLIGRKVRYPITVNGMEIPANASIIMLFYTMHRNPDVFEDPDTFKLDRQWPEECNKRNPFSQVPFSAGPRNCIGQKFAMLELKSTLSKVIRNFKLEPSEEKPMLTIDLITKSANGVKVKIINRD